MYAKTCAKIPGSFSIAPQQLSHVVTTPTTSNLVSKTFLQSVDSITSNCALTHERMVITFNFVVFATEYVLFDEEVHDVLSPVGIFEGNQIDIEISNATHLITVEQFIESRPTHEGVYKMRPTTVSASTSIVYSQKIVIVTKCYNTGYDATKRERANPSVFAEAIEDAEGRVVFDIELVLKKHTSSFDIRNTLNVRVLSTRETFVLRSMDLLAQEAISAEQKLYGTYETAASDTHPSQSKALSNDNLVMRGGDQICSKHQVTGYDAQATVLSPNAIAACMLSSIGENVTDGDAA